MSVKITGTDKIIGKLHGMTDGAPVDAIGAYVVQEIVDRTQRGIDMHGDAFKPYSEAHKKTRIKYGAQTSYVDLNMTGNMLASITHNVRGNTVTILLRAAKENAKAHGHYFGTKNLPRRKFFGIDAKMKKAIIQNLKNWVARGYR